MERMSVNPTAPAARSGSDRDSSTRRPKAFFLGAALFLASLLVLSAKSHDFDGKTKASPPVADS